MMAEHWRSYYTYKKSKILDFLLISNWKYTNTTSNNQKHNDFAKLGIKIELYKMGIYKVAIFGIFVQMDFGHFAWLLGCVLFCEFYGSNDHNQPHL